MEFITARIDMETESTRYICDTKQIMTVKEGNICSRQGLPRQGNAFLSFFSFGCIKLKYSLTYSIIMFFKKRKTTLFVLFISFRVTTAPNLIFSSF